VLMLFSEEGMAQRVSKPVQSREAYIHHYY
jgi:hypothetical protein